MKKSAKAKSFPRLLAEFKSGLGDVFDLGGKNVMDRKENLEAVEFINDQVIKKLISGVSKKIVEISIS